MSEAPYTAATYDAFDSVPRLDEWAELISELLHDVKGMSPERARASLARALAHGRPARFFTVVESPAGRPAGFAFGSISSSLESDGGYFWLNELHVLEAHRGRGAGRILMEHVFRWCRTNGLFAVFGVCAPDNSGAAAFYRRIGFTTENITWLVRPIDGA